MVNLVSLHSPETMKFNQPLSIDHLSLEDGSTIDISANLSISKEDEFLIGFSCFAGSVRCLQFGRVRIAAAKWHKSRNNSTFGTMARTDISNTNFSKYSKFWNLIGVFSGITFTCTAKTSD